MERNNDEYDYQLTSWQSTSEELQFAVETLNHMDYKVKKKKGMYAIFTKYKPKQPSDEFKSTRGGR